MKQKRSRLTCLLLAASILLGGCAAKQPLPTTGPTEFTLNIIEETVPVQQTQPLPDDLDSVPLFFQTDYPDIEYGSGTVATSGCGVTALAMVATYLTERWYYPDELAYYFGTYGENNIQRLEYGCEMMQLPYAKAADWNDVANALKAGGVVIAMMNENSIFTNTQHFLVLRGLTEDGKVLVNDPYGPNYEVWDLKYGYDNGFSQSQIITGYSGGWIFHKSDMPETPFLYEAPLPPYIRRGVSRREQGSRDSQRVVELAPDEEKLIADMLWVLAREEPEQCQQAIAEVVLNRLASGNYPDTVQEILADETLFPPAEAMEKAAATRNQYTAVEMAAQGGGVLTRDVLSFTKEAPDTENREGMIGSFRFHSGR